MGVVVAETTNWCKENCCKVNCFKTNCCADWCANTNQDDVMKAVSLIAVYIFVTALFSVSHLVFFFLETDEAYKNNLLGASIAWLIWFLFVLPIYLRMTSLVMFNDWVIGWSNAIMILIAIAFVIFLIAIGGPMIKLGEDPSAPFLISPVIFIFVDGTMVLFLTFLCMGSLSIFCT